MKNQGSKSKPGGPGSRTSKSHSGSSHSGSSHSGSSSDASRSSARKLTILAPEGRHYSCSECPARCCSSPWGIPVSPDEYERISADDLAKERLDARGFAILRAGVLPMREVHKRLECVFLDDDMLCSLHKKHGHEFIPAPCQAYPFGFSKNEAGQSVALLSRYCPSIRDDRGEAVEPLLPAKLEQAGGARPLGPKLGLRSGRVLGPEGMGLVTEAWRAELREESLDPVSALVRTYVALDALDETLPKVKSPSAAEIQSALDSARALALERTLPLSARGAERSPLHARVLYAYLLGGLSYPSRVLLAHRTTKIGFFERVRALGNRLAFLFGFGKVDLYLAGARVPVGNIRHVSPFLRAPLGRIVSDYLCEVLLRRQGMARQSYFSRVLVDLALMTLLVSRHARAAAAGRGAPEVTEADVREGIGIAELLFSHQGEEAQSAVLQTLRLKLMASEKDFRALVESEL